MMPHDDQAQDADMIKSVLQKIIDEMNGLEADRINPKKPMDMTSEAKVNEEIPMDGEPEADKEGLDPNVLSQLMDKASSADDNGALPEDHENELPEDIMVAIKKKKGLM